MDIDGNGMIEYGEFLAATAKLNTLICEKNLEKAFRQFDRDGSGSITMDELKAGLQVRLPFLTTRALSPSARAGCMWKCHDRACYAWDISHTAMSQWLCAVDTIAHTLCTGPAMPFLLKELCAIAAKLYGFDSGSSKELELMPVEIAGIWTQCCPRPGTHEDPDVY
eukprot:scaffold664770_cov55-Prasinocladus_malaysianus.AAC.1